jgi:hypothetical protein
MNILNLINKSILREQLFAVVLKYPGRQTHVVPFGFCIEPGGQVVFTKFGQLVEFVELEQFVLFGGGVVVFVQFV